MKIDIQPGATYTHTKIRDHENLRALKISKGWTLGNRNPILQSMGPQASVK